MYQICQNGSQSVNLGFLIKEHLIRDCKFRLYRFERLYYFYVCKKFKPNMKNP